MVKNNKKKSLAIIRALDVRIIQAEYATHFKKFRTSFVSDYRQEIDSFLKKREAAYISLKLVSPYLFDPLKLISGRRRQQSWLVFDRKELENSLKPIDVYQIQEPFFLYSGQVANVAGKFDKPLVMAPWMCFNHPSTYILPYSLSVRKSINQTDLFIMRTKRVESYLSHFNIPDSKKVLIYHGVNTKRFFPAKKKKKDKIKILFVGILHESKGLGDILDIFPQLIKESKKNVELIICGKGTLEDRVRDMAKNLPIRYLGYVSNLKLPDIYREADIFCGPSKDWYSFGIKRWEEGFGFVFVEAMASGLPIVTNDCGAIKEVVGENNYVNKQEDKKALLRSLLELINDSKLIRKIGIKNRKRVIKMFDLDKQIKKDEGEFIKRFC